MCGRFNQTASGDELAEAFALDEVPQLAPRYNIAPTQPVAVIGVQPKTGRRGLALLTWGLVPSDSLGGERGFINARAETAADKPSFSEAFARRRCLIPATGFYEWQKLDAKRRQPWLIRLATAHVFAFAGLWEPPTAQGGDADLHHPDHGAERGRAPHPRPHARDPAACGLRALARSGASRQPRRCGRCSAPSPRQR